MGHFHQQEAIEKAKNKELNDLKSDYDTLEQLFTEVKTKLHNVTLLRRFCVLTGVYVNVFLSRVYLCVHVCCCDTASAGEG